MRQTSPTPGCGGLDHLLREEVFLSTPTTEKERPLAILVAAREGRRQAAGDGDDGGDDGRGQG
jgi:hypothetical protein